MFQTQHSVGSRNSDFKVGAASKDRKKTVE